MNFTTTDKSESEGFCLVKTADRKQTAKGVPYLDLVLADAGGEIGAKLWDFNEASQGWIVPNVLVKVRGSISPFNGEDQMRVSRIRPVTDVDGVKLEDLIPSAQYTGEKMLDDIIATVRSFKNPDISALVLACLEEKREKLLYFPAALKLHHAIRGGLLVHTLSVLRLAQSVAALYPFVDSDLLFAGAILHDIAKTDEYDAPNGIASAYTVEGTLVGHGVRGAMLIERIGIAVGTPRETLTLLEHMLISHHGEPEFGAAVRPLFLEADILSELDMLDARIFEIASAAGGVKPGEFTSKQWALDNRKLYNHGLSGGGTTASLFK